MNAPGGNFKRRWFAKKTVCAHGHRHDSIAEAKRCAELHTLQAIGAIRLLAIHPTYKFVKDGNPVKHDNGRQVSYTPDFQYFEGDNNIVEDVKGRRIDPSWPIRRAFFRVFFPYIELRVVKA